MMTTLYMVRQSSFPKAIGACVDDIPKIAVAVNEAQERLIFAGGDTGWWGAWQRVRLPINSTAPYITLPRQFNRIINMAVCRQGIPINNEFFELLPHGNGLAPAVIGNDWCGRDIEGYERGMVPTMVDLTPTNQKLRVFVTDPRDIGKRMLISALDQNGNPFYDASPSLGFYMTFAQPFTDTIFQVSQIQTIQKDYTFGDIVLQQVDVTTGAAVNLGRFGPTEINPSYRRYLISAIPSLCCGVGSLPPNLTVTALCKLQYIPATQDTDWLIIQNTPALIEMAQALRYSRMDSVSAAGLEAKHEKAAIKQLRNQMRHEEGEQNPAVNVDIFPGHDLERQSIGALI